MRPTLGFVRVRSLRSLGALAVCGITASMALAQSSVSVKVETTHGAMVNDVKVLTRHIETDKHRDKNDRSQPPAKSPGEPLSETDTGQYEIDHLKKGKYRFYACDNFLTYEPDFNDVDLGESDHKKFTLVLQEQLVTQKIKDVDPGVKVCLIHDETGCFAVKVVDRSGNITYRGIQDHYHVEDAQACKKD